MIDKLKIAIKLEDVIDTSNFDEEYRKLSKLVHPDTSTLSDANDLFIKLQKLKQSYFEGTHFNDDAGIHIYKDNEIIFNIKDKSVRTLSKFNHNIFYANSKHSDLLQKYLPLSMYIKDEKLICKLNRRGIPLCDLPNPLEQVHVNWIFSRLVEFIALCHPINYAHCGFNPESIFVTPEDHGIQIVSFYHSSSIGSRIKTISGRYKNWYPSSLFREKIITPDIDIKLAKKIAICLLGDKSGVGTKLWLDKNVHQGFIDFILSNHTDPEKTYLDYRQFLKDNFERKFYELKV